jgi:ribonucleoside-diphosphate reductase beta chain
MIAGYPHFLGLASRLQWDVDALDLTADAETWPALTPAVRDRLLVLIAGFCVGEQAVASELAPFAAAADDPIMAACFQAQQRDEERHARFFQRVATEIAGIGAPTAREFWGTLRGLLGRDYLELFERRLPGTARAVAADHRSLPEAVGLYHMVLEGVVFTAGQLELLALIAEQPSLPGLRQGVELVVRDERWHVGFGTRCLADAGVPPPLARRILVEGQHAAESWTGATSRELSARVREIHRRRLTAIGAVPPRSATV